MRRIYAIVVGGGPAGLTAAITLAKAGRSVVVLERGETTPDGPGETFHPGIEAIFEQLGVGDGLRRAASARHDAVIVEREGQQETTPYGEGWRGFQIRRKRLNRVLEARLDSLGGERRMGDPAIHWKSSLDRHVVDSEQGTFEGRWLLDASGMAGWLDRRTATSLQAVSTPIWLRYGYDTASTSDGTLPRLRIDGRRWTWRAPLGDGETAWVESAHGRPFGERKPGARGADGTWRLSSQPAGSGFFRIGDAACRLDPSNGHGVLRAMMSAMMASHLATLADGGEVGRGRVADIYAAWIGHWFGADVDRLRAQFMDLSIGGA